MARARIAVFWLLAGASTAGCPAGEKDRAGTAPPAGSDAAAAPGADEAAPPPPVLIEPISILIDQARGNGRGDFAAPAEDELDAFAALVEEIARAAAAAAAPVPGGLPPPFVPIARWNARARALGFEVAIARERETYVLLRELEGIRRGGGAYALRARPADASPAGAAAGPGALVIQAPHSFFDEGTGEIARDLFERTGAAFAVNTIPRYLGARRPPAGPAPADVASAERSWFQAFTVGVSRALPRAAFVQIHGFAAEAHPELAGFDVVASKGEAAGVFDPGFERLVAGLRAALGEKRVAVFGREARTLGATRNVQGRFLNARSDDFFWHLELSRPLRARLEADAGLRARFADALGEAVERDGK